MGVGLSVDHTIVIIEKNSTITSAIVDYRFSLGKKVAIARDLLFPLTRSFGRRDSP